MAAHSNVMREVLARAKGATPSGVMVCVLERPRHESLIEEIRATGARIRLIPDGDVAGVIHCAEPEKTGIDMYMGSGGAPEGVLAAAALKCMGGQMLGRLLFRNDDERKRATAAGINDLEKVYTRDDMVTDDVIFEASFGKDPWGSRVVGKAAVRDFLGDMFDRIPDIRWDETRHSAHSDVTVVEWVTSGTPRGAGRFETHGCDVLALRDGKIAAKRSYRKGTI